MHESSSGLSAPCVGVRWTVHAQQVNNPNEKYVPTTDINVNRCKYIHAGRVLFIEAIVFQFVGNGKCVCVSECLAAVARTKWKIIKHKWMNCCSNGNVFGASPPSVRATFALVLCVTRMGCHLIFRASSLYFVCFTIVLLDEVTFVETTNWVHVNDSSNWRFWWIDWLSGWSVCPVLLLSTHGAANFCFSIFVSFIFQR